MANTIDLGMVTAYAYAVAGGYTGTEQEFEELLGTIASGHGSIAGIEKTGTSGNVDTFTITYTDGTTSTFTVTNGSVTSVDGQTGDVVLNLDQKANIDGYYENLTAGYAENLLSNIYFEDQVPYNFRTAGGALDIGNYEKDTITGGSLAFNQHVRNFNSTSTNDGITWTNNGDGTWTANGTATADSYKDVDITFTTLTGHKCLITGCPSGGSLTTYWLQDGYRGNQYSGDIGSGRIYEKTNNNAIVRLYVKSGVTVNNLVFKPQYFDLTQMFGSTIADYIYSLEQATPGAGVAWFKQYFPKSYYEYNAGELMHVQTTGHKMVGFNQWDEEVELGSIDDNGANVVSTNSLRTKNYNPVLPNTVYHVDWINRASTTQIRLYWYDADKNYINKTPWTNFGNYTTPANAHYMRFKLGTTYGTTYNNDICINLSWDGERDGEYEAYKANTYPLDSDLVLRGIPKLDSGNKLYYDGDTYEPEGTVTRKFGVVDLGSLNYTTGNNNVFHAQVEGLKTVANWTTVPNMICAAYRTTYGDAVAAAVEDKVIANYGTQDRIIIRDTAYNDSISLKTALSGVYLVYELAESTTETADTFTDPQQVSNWGTEEYIDNRAIPVPVGHLTKYPPNLKAKLETIPNPPEADGDYLVRQLNGVNEYISLGSNATIQDILDRLTALEGGE